MKTILLALFLLLSSTYILADTSYADQQSTLKVISEDAKEDKKSDNTAEEKECLETNDLFLLPLSKGILSYVCKTLMPSDYDDREHKPPRFI